MKEIFIEDLAKKISDEVRIKKKIARDAVELVFLDIKNRDALRGYSTVTTGEAPESKLNVPMIDGRKDILIPKIELGTPLDSGEAEKTVRIIKAEILSGTKEEDVVSIKELGVFRSRKKGNILSGLIYQPSEPENFKL